MLILLQHVLNFNFLMINLLFNICTIFFYYIFKHKLNLNLYFDSNSEIIMNISENPAEIEKIITSYKNDSISFQRFGTYLLLFKEYRKDDWEMFNSDKFSDIIQSMLPNLHLPIIIVLSDRHIELLHIILDYFDTIQKELLESKLYVQFLVKMAPFIPVRWLARHIFKIPKNSVHFVLTNYFQDASNITPDLFASHVANSNTWELINKLKSERRSDTITKAWIDMFTYRTAAYELKDFNLTFDLDEYVGMKKEDVVNKTIRACDNYIQLARAFKTQIIPFCKANDLDAEDFLVSYLGECKFNLDSKLNIIRNLIQNKTDKERALLQVTFKNGDEYNVITDFAKVQSLNFSPALNSHISNADKRFSVDSGTPKSSRKSKSLAPGEKLSISSFRRSPSFESSAFFDESAILIANGEPNDPKEYEAKLERYKLSKEIAPLYQCAHLFNIVVSYQDFYNSLIDGKSAVFKKILLNEGFGRFSTIVDALSFTNEDVMSLVKNGDELDFYLLIDNLLKYIDRGTSELFITATEVKLMNNLITSQEEKNEAVFSKIVKLWINCIQNCFPYVPYEHTHRLIMHFVVMCMLEHPLGSEHRRVLIKLLKSDNYSTGSYVKLCRRIASKSNDRFEELESIDTDNFVNYFTSPDLRNISRAFLTAEMCVLGISATSISRENLESLITQAIPEISGHQYTLLSFSYNILQRNYKKDYSREIKVLKILYMDKTHTNINFHDLNRDPATTLLQYSTFESVQCITNIAKIYNVDSDPFVVHILKNKMTTNTNITEYLGVMSYLSKKDNSEVYQILLHRLSEEDLYRVFDLKSEHKCKCLSALRAHNLREYITLDLLNDPEKLITELYSKESLHDRLGMRLHNLCDFIASLYNIDILPIREKLLKIWLLEEPTISDATDNIFDVQPFESADENDSKSVQKLLFITRCDEHKVRDYIKWLITFSKRTDNPIASARATASLVGLASQSDINGIFRGDLSTLVKQHKFNYFKGRVKLFGDQKVDLDSISYEKLVESIYSLPDDSPEFDILKIECMINGNEYTSRSTRDSSKKQKSSHSNHRSSAVSPRRKNRSDDSVHITRRKRITKRTIKSLIVKLSETRPLYIIRLIKRLNGCPSLFGDGMRDSLDKCIYKPFEQLLQQYATTRKLSPRNQLVIADAISAISVLPYQLKEFRDGSNLISLSELVDKLISNGLSLLAADLGIHTVDTCQRNQILLKLVKASAFDNLLYIGFDKETVFKETIRNGCVNSATMIMEDKNYADFTNWLLERRDFESLNLVKNALQSQGRTVSAKNLEERIKSLNV